MNRHHVTRVLFATAQTAVLTIVETNNSEKGLVPPKSWLTSANAERGWKIPGKAVSFGKAS
jgi:hypothetical protein